MTGDLVSIPLAHIIESARFVPCAQRPAFFATLLIGAKGCAGVAGILADTGNPGIEAGPRSVSLTCVQVRKLKDRLDRATWDVIRAAVENLEDGVAVVDWQQVRKLTGATSWAAFAKGRLGGLNRALANIGGVPPRPVLLWRRDDWVKGENGEYLSGTLALDGSAVLAIRSVAGLAPGCSPAAPA